MYSQHDCKTQAAKQCASCVFLQNLHLVGRHPHANFIPPAASGMQISFSWPPAGCKFHSVGRQPDANFIQSAASRMQIATG
jgi:hypothetical protein